MQRVPKKRKKKAQKSRERIFTSTREVKLVFLMYNDLTGGSNNSGP